MQEGRAVFVSSWGTRVVHVMVCMAEWTSINLLC